MTHVDELLGKTVLGAAGNYIGEITNIDIDSNWQITYLHIKLSSDAAKEFGLKKTLTIKIPTSFVNHIGVIIRLNRSLKDLKNTLHPYA
jgi:sporulation protein YlmC with PRC-barrel domain